MPAFAKGNKLGRRFQKGQSGNPSGMPKIIIQVAAAAKQYTFEALEVLASVMRDKDAAPSARVTAATALLDRAWGRPMQAVDVKISNDDVRNMTDAQLLDIIQQQRAQSGDAGEGTVPAPTDQKQLN